MFDIQSSITNLRRAFTTLVEENHRLREENSILRMNLRKAGDREDWLIHERADLLDQNAELRRKLFEKENQSLGVTINVCKD